VVTGSELASSALRASQFRSQVEGERPENEYVGFSQEFLRYMLSDGAGAFWLSDQPRPSGLSLRIEWLDIFSFANECEVCMYAGGLKDHEGNLRGWRQEELSLEEVVRRGYFNLSQDVDVLVKNVIPMAGRTFEILQKNRGLTGGDIDWILPHISSMFFKKPLEEAAAEMGIDVPADRWYTNLPYKGNIGSASIYVILEELWASGKLKPGHRVVCAVPESARFSFACMYLTVMGP
jgi:3-oxoacyl-[acyl-carrier-protein] synthase-3